MAERIYVFTLAFLLLTSMTYGKSEMDSYLQSSPNHFDPRSNDIQTLSTCRISTRDLISTAQATASRILQGVCNPRELDDRFTSLDNQMVEQFNVLKTMVLNVEDKMADLDEKIKSQHKRTQQSIRAMRMWLSKRGLNSGVEFHSKGQEKEFDDESVTQGTSKTTEIVILSNGNGSLSFITPPNQEDYEEYSEDSNDVDQLDEKAVSPRQEEITSFNSTIYQEGVKRVFTYYWTVRDMTYKMKSWGWRRSLRSNSFSIFQYGYRMYLRIYPNRQGENVYVHVGITKGEYDNALDWPFKLKHKVQVLDHSSRREDISSRIWDPTKLCSEWNWSKPESGDNYECVGLGFPKDTLFNKNYLINDSIVIKLTVYLN